MASYGAVQQNRLVCSQGNACLACNAGILGHATNDAQACRTSSVLASSSGGWKARELHQGEERKSSGMSLTTNTHGLRLHCTQFTMCRQHHNPLPSIQTKGCHSPAVPAHHAALVAVLDCLLGHVPAGGNHKAQQHHWLAGACKLFQSTPIAVAQLVPTASGGVPTPATEPTAWSRRLGLHAMHAPQPACQLVAVLICVEVNIQVSLLGKREDAAQVDGRGSQGGLAAEAAMQKLCCAWHTSAGCGIWHARASLSE